MPLDIAILAGSIVTSFLLPYVKLGAEKLSEQLSENTSQAVADGVSNLASRAWQRVKQAFQSEDEQSALSLFESKPEQLKALVTEYLEGRLKSDPKLAEDLQAVLDERVPGGGGSTGAEIIQHAGIAGVLDARGADFSGSTNARLAGVMVEDASKVPKPSAQPPSSA